MLKLKMYSDIIFALNPNIKRLNMFKKCLNTLKQTVILTHEKIIHTLAAMFQYIFIRELYCGSINI